MRESRCKVMCTKLAQALQESTADGSDDGPDGKTWTACPGEGRERDLSIGSFPSAAFPEEG